MPYDPDIHHRRSIRLKDYDYSKEGAYFITICTYNRLCIFGKIEDVEMHLSSIGEIIKKHWEKLPSHHAHLSLAEWVIMPNHLHGILVLAERESLETRSGVSEIIRGFKSFAAIEVNRYREMVGAPVWQRNYHERIIRNEKDYQRIAEYLAANPAKWADDTYFEE